MIADERRQMSTAQRVKLRLQRFYAMAQLLKLKLLRLCLGLKITALAFQCFVLGANKRQAFAQDCRRAVLVDQLFEQFPHRMDPPGGEP